ncbi:MAG: sigma-70 family RNA polymerase sigma factor [Clostridia bacterium]|nr:sigma-70 family RNA polymerase sigma factor [Clostridia bacterium]
MTDTELVAKIKKGDMAAFDKLVSEYNKRVANIAYSLLSDREDALDASQEVFIKVYKNIGTFRGESTVSTWIYRITKNVCTDMLRKRRSTLISLDDDDDESPKLEIADVASSPEYVAEKNEKIRIVRKAVAALDENQRTLVTLYDINGLSYEEIAAVLKCPLGTVKSRLYRARESLRKILSENKELFL